MASRPVRVHVPPPVLTAGLPESSMVPGMDMQLGKYLLKEGRIGWLFIIL